MIAFGACSAQQGTPFARRMIEFIDCQAQAIGAGGFQALASPGSTLSLVLTGFLTLFIAFIGYRLLFGQGLNVRDAVLAFVKIGVVLALATSWTVYRTLVYDVALKGPTELAADIGRPAALPGSAGGLAARLANVDRGFQMLAIEGTGRLFAPPAVQGRGGAAQQVPGAVPEMFPGFDSWALGGARITFLTAALGALAIVRLIAGLMLALGPFFIAFMMFESTRGLFEGWIRILAGAALGALGTAIALGVELALLEPWLVSLLSQRYAGLATPGAAVELLVATLLFGLALIAILYGAARVAYGFALPPAWRAAPAQVGATLRGEEARIAAAATEGAAPAFGRSRAAAVADAVATTQRRENPPARPALAAAPSGGRIRPAGPEREITTLAPAPLGRSYRRRTTARVSASAGRRDYGR